MSVTDSATYKWSQACRRRKDNADARIRIMFGYNVIDHPVARIIRRDGQDFYGYKDIKIKAVVYNKQRDSRRNHQPG